MRSPKQQFTTRIHYYNGSERTRLCSKKNMIFVSCEQKHFWFEGKLTPFLNNWSVHLSINGYIKKNHVSSVSLTIFTIMQSKSIWQKIRKFYYLPWSPWAQLNCHYVPPVRKLSDSAVIHPNRAPSINIEVSQNGQNFIF
jgi:hypothetical protein